MPIHEHLRNEVYCTIQAIYTFDKTLEVEFMKTINKRFETVTEQHSAARQMNLILVIIHI